MAKASEDVRTLRKRIRAGEWTGTTSGMAPAHVQGNVTIVPEAYAGEFLRFCQLNPKPCPLLGVSEAGNPALPALGDIDIRTDVPRYRVFEDGRCVDEPHDIQRWWRDDLVAFVLGCSLCFEDALLEAGLRLEHVERGTAVPMFKTSIATRPAGRFHGPLVVSMRPFRPAEAIRAIQVSSRFPTAHGAPVHIGFPQAIGIADLARPDYGSPVEVQPDQLPLFWACGVTPQAVVEAAKLPFCITHYPGSMLITDMRNADIAVL
ncbi:MAG TPA: putative hydro-lyase [Burkholderiales bacterium]